MKLRCFSCGHKFKNITEVFRNLSGHPLCEDCLYEYLSDEEHWDSDYAEDMIIDIKNNFHRNYKQFYNDFHAKMDICDGCEDMYYTKESLTEINGMKYCEMCVLNIKEKGEAKPNELHA